MQPAQSLLLPALLFTVIGIVIGVVAVLIIVDRTRIKTAEKPSAEMPVEPGEEPGQVPGLPADRFDSIALLYRERSSGRLAVEVDKKAYLTADAVPPDIRHTLEMASEGLTHWLGKGFEPPPAPIKSEPAPPPVIPPPTPPAKSEAPSAQSIVTQINDILQEVLAESPLAERKISLMQEPSMGVIVWVDGVKYSSIDSVPDPAVKELIQTAVRKWEKKNDLSRRYP